MGLGRSHWGGWGESHWGLDELLPEGKASMMLLAFVVKLPYSSAQSIFLQIAFLVPLRSYPLLQFVSRLQTVAVNCCISG